MNVVRFYRRIYADNEARRDRRRSLRRDLSLYAKNRGLRLLERALIRRHYREDLPIVFIVGAPRSGTTLLFQLIARYVSIGYVNNFMARYFMAPVYGAVRYRRRFGAGPGDIPLESHLGVADGPHSPHEFSYFWQFFTDFGERDDLTDSELAAIDWDPLRRELLALAGWFGQPLVLKSINYVDYNIEWIARVLPQSRFIYITRDPRFVVQSILESRIKRYGTDRAWWSVRPRDFASWDDREPLHQVCHQVQDLQRAIAAGLSGLPPSVSHELTYENLVANPAAELQRIAGFVGGSVRDEAALSQLALTTGNQPRMDSAALTSVPHLMSALAAESKS
jgi:hypothetical protein